MLPTTIESKVLHGKVRNGDLNRNRKLHNREAYQRVQHVPQRKRSLIQSFHKILCCLKEINWQLCLPEDAVDRLATIYQQSRHSHPMGGRQIQRRRESYLNARLRNAYHLNISDQIQPRTNIVDRQPSGHHLQSECYYWSHF